MEAPDRAMIARTVRGFARFALALFGVFACAGCMASGQSVAVVAPPDRLGDVEFRRLIEQFSEPGGTFHSENYLSNENRYQTVISELVTRAKPGRLYVGVGPEQNFTYMSALRPRMAFIVDIRRGNLREHLLYKALMELSSNRAEFLSRLFGRRVPAGVGPASSVNDLFDAFSAAPPSEPLFAETMKAVTDVLQRRHGLGLPREDLTEMEGIYRTAFYADGPGMMYRRTDGIDAGRRPTYAELMTWDDGAGRQRSYLVDEASFAFLKDLQTRNLVVPIVGDFGGPKALRAVARYAREHGLTVSAFYLSNVEMYLHRDGKYAAFCASVAAMPLDASSTFIRSQPAGGGFYSLLGPIQSETRGCGG